jgi:hypothetical protein
VREGRAFNRRMLMGETQADKPEWRAEEDEHKELESRWNDGDDHKEEGDEG